MGKETILKVLRARGIKCDIPLDPVEGPRTYTYQLRIGPEVSVAKVLRLERDISVALGTQVQVKVPLGQAKGGALSIEVTRADFKPVALFSAPPGNRTMIVNIGVNTYGGDIPCDIPEMPHLLIAGVTGGGKSMMLQSLLCQLARYSPTKVNLFLVDIKRVEMMPWQELPHLVRPVAIEPRQAVIGLRLAVTEIQARYKLFTDRRCANLEEYNNSAFEKLPRVVVVIDELADLMFSCEGIEEIIGRIAQLGRAAGFHLVAATQRPDSRVITGLLKANIPSRLALTTASAVDSRVVGVPGAEKLQGMGEFLFKPVGALTATRGQGYFVSKGDIENAKYVASGFAKADCWELPVPKEVVRPARTVPTMLTHPAETIHVPARSGSATFVWAWMAVIVIMIVMFFVTDGFK